MTINRFMIAVDFMGVMVAACLIFLGDNSLIVGLAGGILFGSGIWRIAQEFEQ